MLYGAVGWDPVLIITQIISLQCLFYLTVGLAQALLLGPFIGHLSILFIFNWRTIEVHNTAGWMNISSNLVTACMGAVYLMWIVERAKKCLDFASTTYLFHFVLCWILSGFPASFVWWITNGIGLLIMALLGEWFCVQKELQDIPLSSSQARGASSGGSGPAAAMGAASRSGSGSAGQPSRNRGESAPLLELTTGPGSGVGSSLGSGVGSGVSSGIAARAATSATLMKPSAE